MDSKIQKALEAIAKLEQDNCYATGNRLEDEIQTQNALRQCGDIARALLTAEPEPGEDLKAAFEKVWGSAYSVDARLFADSVAPIGSKMWEAATVWFDAYDSQVADKRAEELQHQLDMSRKISRVAKDIAIRHMRKEKELRAQVETLRAALQSIAMQGVSDQHRNPVEMLHEKIEIAHEALAATEPKS